MKQIEELSEATLKSRLKAIYALPQDTLDAATLRERARIENRLWELHVEQHPPVHTPPNFLERQEEW